MEGCPDLRMPNATGTNLRIEAGEDRRLASIIEPVRTAMERREDREGLITQAGDGIEPAALGFDVRIGHDRIQMRDEGLDAEAHAGVSDRKLVLLVGAQNYPRVAAGDQHARSAPSGRRWRPLGRALAGAKIGNRAGIDRIGFGAHLPRRAIGLDLDRIDPARQVAGIG